jgi:hypothetical protein
MPGPTGARPTKATYPGQSYITLKRKALSRMDGDIKELMRSLTSVTDKMSFYRLTTEHISRALIDYCSIILNDAIERAPYRTGELRSSGKITIRSGAKQVSGMVFPAVDVRADSKGNWELRQHIDSIKRPAALITAEISFEKVDDGKDIALWAHEDLLPYSARPGTAAERRADADRRNMDIVLYATKPGTGPKYLEGPFNIHLARMLGTIQAALNTAIELYNSKTGQRVRRR